MKVIKKVIGQLEKCYSLAEIPLQGRNVLLVAAEKKDACLIFEKDGTPAGRVWDGPGGVMTMTPVPGRRDLFLATQKFYSPNDSAEAKLVAAAFEDGSWNVKTIAELPFVHRFGILERNGRTYILACTLKSAHEYRDDWRFPGKVFAAVLPDDPADTELRFTVLREGLGHNHGYTFYRDAGSEAAVISCDQGVFLFRPPAEADSDWSTEELLDSPASDAVLSDLDGDGQPELFVISPFHGDRISIFRKNTDGCFERVYEYPGEVPFLHAIDAGRIAGKDCVMMGCRGGGRELLMFTYDPACGQYRYDVIDQGAGPANCMIFADERGENRIIAANRETNEIALYSISEED